MPLSVQSSRAITICLRIPQLILGLTNVGLMTYATTMNIAGRVITCSVSQSISFLVMSSVYVTPCFLLLVTTLHKESAENMRKTIFELMFNIFAAAGHFFGSLSIFILVAQTELVEIPKPHHIAAGIMGVILAVLYSVSFYISLNARRIAGTMPGGDFYNLNKK